MQELYLTQLLHGWFGEWFELILWRPSPELECENHSKCSSTQLQDYCWQILVMAMSSGTRGRKTGSLEWGLSRVINIKHETRGDNDWEWRHWQQGRILVIVQRQSPCLNRQWWNVVYLSLYKAFLCKKRRTPPDWTGTAKAFLCKKRRAISFSRIHCRLNWYI